MTPRIDLHGITRQYDPTLRCWTATREDGWLVGCGPDERAATQDLLRQEDEACAAAGGMEEAA